MSADNWMACPRCFAQAISEYQAKAREIEKSYGNVSVMEFDRSREALGDFPTVYTFTRQLREDYEIGISDTGEFYVKYHGLCGICGFGHTFNCSVQLAIAAETEESKR